MAAFPSTIPVDPTEVSTYLRFWLGDLPTSTLSEANMLAIIDIAAQDYMSNPCKATYYSALAVLRYLIRAEAQGSAGSGGGALIERSEKEGGVEVKEKYSTTSSGSSTGWDKVLEDLLASPSTIGCDPFAGETTTNTGSVIIGGADVNGYEGALRSQNSFDEARYSFRSSGLSPWRPRS